MDHGDGRGYDERVPSIGRYQALPAGAGFLRPEELYSGDASYYARRHAGGVMADDIARTAKREDVYELVRLAETTYEGRREKLAKIGAALEKIVSRFRKTPSENRCELAFVLRLPDCPEFEAARAAARRLQLVFLPKVPTLGETELHWLVDLAILLGEIVPLHPVCIFQLKPRLSDQRVGSTVKTFGSYLQLSYYHTLYWGDKLIGARSLEGRFRALRAMWDVGRHSNVVILDQVVR